MALFSLEDRLGVQKQLLKYKEKRHGRTSEIILSAYDVRLSYCFFHKIATSGHGCPGERPNKTGGRIGTGCVTMSQTSLKQLERLHPKPIDDKDVLPCFFS